MKKVLLLLFIKWVTWSYSDSLECCGINYSRYTDGNESQGSIQQGFYFFVSDLPREILQYFVEIFEILRSVTLSSKIFENSTRNVIHYEGCQKTNSFKKSLKFELKKLRILIRDNRSTFLFEEIFGKKDLIL